jgi:two-component system nitrate/nitrite response regulator NarL
MLEQVNMEKAIRVMVVDDHPSLREGLMALLRYETDIEVVGYAVDGEDALIKAVEFHPDVVLMDISMPKMNGLEATRQLRETLPAIRVLMFTGGETPNDVLEAMLAGAAGYADKKDSVETLGIKIKAVHAGIPIFPAISPTVNTANAALNNAKKLTPTELKILQLAVQGLSAKGMARALSTPEKDVGEKLVNTHLANIRAKWDVRNAVGMVLYAIKNGLVDMPR